MSRSNVLADISVAYTDSQRRYQQYADRGNHDKADEYLSEMQEMERCIQVHETSTSWRRTIAARIAREQKGSR
jgi:hypothetical protein